MKSRIGFLLRFYVLTVLVFIVAKVVFMLCNQSVAPFSAGDVCAVLWHGLSLDLSTALYFLIIPFLLTVASMWWRLPRWVFVGYYIFISVAFVLAFVADTSMYAFWQFKLDASWLSYLETPAEAMASVSMGYVLFRLVLFLLLASVLSVLYIRFCGYPFVGRFSLCEALVDLLLLPAFVIGIRGGFDESTTNVGQVYYSQNQFLNHSAVNPVFSFLYSMSHQTGDLSQYQFFPAAECEQLVSDVYTTESIDTDTLLTTTRPDIFIILLESAGEQFADAMPRLQQLKQQGIYFSRCYANSWRTDRGTVSVLSGYPSFPTLSVMKIPEMSRTLPSIARTLQAQGYQTSYLYGGDINFTNMRGYLVTTGWDRLTSKDDFSLSEQRSAQWGVRDDITFDYLYQTIVKGEAGGGHLWGYSTLSSHEPWDVPLKRLDDEVENAFAYLDDCLADFVDRLRMTPLWDNLLIVLIADHGIIHNDVDQMQPLRKNHIPMLWLGGAVRQPRVVDRLCNQSDLAATLLGQLRLPHDDFAFSRDILSATYVHPTAVNNYSNAQWMTDSTGHVLYDFDTHRMVVSESTDTASLMRLNRAILQVTTEDLMKR
ncbi:MAG: LTA synthase family protein [Prevotella sp.]|nr:LTA synthase family protein [Prevotella sp.]